jgi:hypothetical protein
MTMGLLAPQDASFAAITLTYHPSRVMAVHPNTRYIAAIPNATGRFDNEADTKGSYRL